MSEEANEPQVSPGMIGWNEVVTTDNKISIDFYTQLFGWTVDEMPMPDGSTYTIFKNDDKPVGGCAVPPAEINMQPQWLQYVNVVDLDAKIEKAVELGGTVHTARVDLPMGSFAIVGDPVGATFAFWQTNPDYQC